MSFFKHLLNEGKGIITVKRSIAQEKHCTRNVNTSLEGKELEELTAEHQTPAEGVTGRKKWG